jgi:hypothetical protein
MLTLIRDGGVPMWFILAFGLCALVSAIRYAMQPAATVQKLTRGMAMATLFATLAALASDLGKTLHTLAGQPTAELSLEQPHGALILLTGLAESMSPLIMGFALLALTAMFGAIGAFRDAASKAE